MMIPWARVSCCLSTTALYLLGRSSGRDADVLKSVTRVNQLKNLVIVSKVKQESSDSSDSDASPEEENETETMSSILSKKSATDAKIVPDVASKKKQESSDSSDSDSSSEETVSYISVQLKAIQKKGAVKTKELVGDAYVRAGKLEKLRS